MDRLREMEIFAATVAGGSLSAGARALGLSVPVVSKEIMRLEARLGSRLLVRTSRHFALTDEGHRFHEAALRVLADLQEAETSVGDGVAAMQGPVRISAPVSLGRRMVAPVLARLVRDHPGLRPYLHLDDAVANLAEDVLDAAIRIGAVTEFGLVARKLADSDRVVCGDPAYLARAGTPETPEDLVHHAMLLGAATTRTYVLEAANGEQRTVRVEAALHSNCADVLQEWAMMSQGLVVRSWVDVAQEIAAGTLVRVLPGWRIPTGGIFAVFPSRRHVAPRVRRVVDAIGEALSAASRAARTCPPARA